MPSVGVESKAAASRDWSSVEPPLSPWILEAASAMGFATMTPVQASTIPLFMGNKDVVVEAVTGSGKTLSFLIPIVERLLRPKVPTKKHHVASIIIAPTRELAIQIDNVLRSLISFHPPSSAVQGSTEASDDLDAEESAALYSSSPKIIPQLLVSGTKAPAEDLKAFLDQSPNVLVATPGRLLELLSSPRVHCPQSSFEVLVLDEADRLLDLGFKDDLQKVLGRLPKQRRTGLFSASVSEALDQLIRVGLRNPVRIAVKVKSSSGKHDQKTPTSLSMTYAVTPASQKLPMLCQILNALRPTPLRTIVYMSTCAAVDYFQHVLPPLLSQHDTTFTLVPLHGKHTPKVRQKNFARFAEATSPSVLLTTDVAARGLDIPQVDLVAQIDPPLDPKAFLHRCGRAGRAGRKGLAVVFLRPGREEDYIQFLEVRKTPIKPLQQPGVALASKESADFTMRIRSTVQEDRALHEKAQRGFVSCIQAYSKHQARSIFQISDLDWTDLGNSWGLLKMPRMPELKSWDGDRSLGVNMDFDHYQFRDKKRETQRQLSLEQKQDIAVKYHKAGTSAKRSWSDVLDHKDEREKRRMKKRSKKEAQKWEQMTPEERVNQAELERLIEKAKQYHMEENESFEGFSE